MKLHTPSIVAALALTGAWAAQGHDLSAQAVNAPGWFSAGAVQTPGTAASAGNGIRLAASFSPFKPIVRFYNDANYFYVEGDSMPDATLMPNPMVGITAWQQQIPIAASYFGGVTNPETDSNALGFGQPNVWRIPLVPVAAASPVALSNNFMRGAVAIAVNGIPIFNPRNNTGQFSQAIGELDQYGGHCGRADDYHYHIAPTHLNAVVGNSQPIAWALDGYPVYGYLEPDGSAQQALDADGGHSHGTWGYHYHARGTSATGPQSPYLMSAMHGNVVNYGGQIDPQPTVGSVTSAGSPLSGAEITAFTRPAPDSYLLTYKVGSTNYHVSWQVDRIAHTVTINRETPTGTTNGTYTNASRFNCYPMAGASMDKLPDTGQTLSATTVFGEDSDYTINPPSFTDNGDGTVTDNVTGLMWQKTDSSEMTWDSARTGAASLGLAGYFDWRLPTAQEALSILNHDRNPALDSTYFVNNAGGTPGYFWTSDLFYGDNTKVWASNTGGGLGPHPKTSTLSAGGTLRFHARYVRGAPPNVGHNYVNNNDGTVTDLDTGLMWSQSPSGTLTWSNALAYAENLTAAGYSDWRVPNVKELQSLLDVTRATASSTTTAPCLNRQLFPSATATAYWSSTSVKQQTPSAAWLVDFGINTTSNPQRNQQGIVSYQSYTSTYPVFVVRTATLTTQIVIEQPAGSPLTDGVSAVSYGSVKVGSSLTKTFLIRNTGSTALEISSVTIDGPDAGSFIVGAAPGSSIEAGGSSTLEVRFDAATAGTKTATLHVASSDPAVGAAFDCPLNATGLVDPPSISAISIGPTAPSYLDKVWLTAAVEWSPGSSLSRSVQATYDTGAMQTNTAFKETMRSTATNPWTGDGCDNSWMTTPASSGDIAQTSSANHTPTGSGNPCGLEFKKGTASLSDRMVTLSNAINATGNAGSIEFWVAATNVSAGQGWTMQLSADGTNYFTRAGELTGTNHSAAKFHYDLTSPELTNTLKMRFQFAGNGVGGQTGSKVQIDDITVSTIAGLPPAVVNMFDDGSHGDGAAGDGVYGGAAPPQIGGTTINYHITASDAAGGATTSPGASYAVSSSLTDSVFTSSEFLGRPTDTSVTMNMFSAQALELYVEIGTASGACTAQTTPSPHGADEPINIKIGSLLPDTAYFYRVRYRPAGSSGGFLSRGERSFCTAKARGKSFTFTITADPHLDENTSTELLKVALDNVAADEPDFHIDLGDIFMTDKLDPAALAPLNMLLNYANIVSRCRELRAYFGRTCHSVPFLLCLGNHEGEEGWYFDGTPNCVAAWDVVARRFYYPNPVPGVWDNGTWTADPFFTGNTQTVHRNLNLGLLEDYYAWEWGDALFIVLDPFWNTATNPNQANDAWQWTLGKTQYDWLKETLANSSAKYKFVFTHHLVGGTPTLADGVTRNVAARGGVEVADKYEWGGKNTDGTDGFVSRRPGWDKPIHQLLVENGVNAVFHGHDHFYGCQTLDGVVYQECPQPGTANYTQTGSSADGKYSTGVILPNSGHLRVTVGPTQAFVEYVRAYRSVDETTERHNRDVSHSYALAPRLYPEIEVTDRTSDTVTFRWTAIANKPYAVQWSPDLINWTTFDTVSFPATHTSASYNDTAPHRVRAVRGFYRVAYTP